MARRDPVGAELRVAVLERDQGCVAFRLNHLSFNVEPDDACSGYLTLDHVKDQPMMG